MRTFLILSIIFFSIYNYFSQTGSVASGIYTYKCDSAIGPKSKSLDELSYKNIFLYYLDGALKSDIEYNLNNKTWEPRRKKEYVYNEGKLISETNLKYNAISQAWAVEGKIEYQYNLTNQLAKKIYSSFVESAMQWDTTALYEYVYNNLELKVECIISQKRPTGFEKNLKFITYLNKFNLADSLLHYEYLEGVLNIREKENYFYDAEGYLKSATTMNSEYGPLQISVIRDVVYDSNKNPTFIDYHPHQKIYYKWELKYNLKGNNKNTLLPYTFEDTEVLAWFRNGLLIENKIYSRANDSEEWMYTNEGGMLYYSGNEIQTSLTSAAEEDINLITISPNPSSGIVNIKITSQEKTLESYSLKNMQGCIIFEEKTLKNFSSIDISSIPDDAYFLELNISGKKYYKKIIKN